VSIGSYRLNYGWKTFRIKKKVGRWREGFGGVIFTDGFKTTAPYSDVTRSPFKMPTESPRDLKWQIRTVTCRVFCQNSRRTHRRIIPSVKPLEKVNICPLCRPSPPLFLLLLPNPNSPHLQTTRPPPPPNKNLPHLSTTSYISWSFVVTTSVFWFTNGFYQFL